MVQHFWTELEKFKIQHMNMICEIIDRFIDCHGSTHSDHAR